MDRRLKNSCNTYEEIAKSLGTLEKLEYCNETNRRLEIQGSEGAYANGKKSSPIRDGGIVAAFGGLMQVGGDGWRLPDFLYFDNPEDGNKYGALRKQLRDIEREKKKRKINLKESKNKIFKQKRLKTIKELKELEEKSLYRVEEKSFQSTDDMENIWTGPSGLFASNSSTKERDKILAEEGPEALKEWVLAKYRKNDYYKYTETPDDGIFNNKRIILVETELVIKHLNEDLVHINLKALLEDLEQMKNQQDNKAA